MREYANAKINLCLDVVKKRTDGYHEMNMIMVPLSLCDTLDIVPSDQDRYECDHADCTMDENNTIVRALTLMRDHFGIKDHFHISLNKQIPMEAGLAGGSADGAALMRALWKMYELPISLKKLALLGKKIGADVPFCIRNTCAQVSGIGEIITPFQLTCDVHVLLVKPKQGVSTAQAFSRLDLQACTHPDTGRCRKALEQGDFQGFCEAGKNTLEYSAFSMVPQLARIKQHLYEIGLPFALMNGSGSTIFALSEKKDQLYQAAHMLQQDYPFVCVCDIL